MIRSLGLLIFCWGMFSCETPQNMDQKGSVQPFISIDSILRAQSNLIIGKNVNKEVKIKEKTESSNLRVDSTFIEKEWDFASAFELNRPGFVGAVETIKKDNRITYQPKAGEKLLFDYLSVEFDGDGSIVSISGAYTDDQADIIYGSMRSFNFDFSEGVLSSYRISGFQKIILRDTVTFEVTGILQ